ncbi:hypothetical protein K2X33_08260, partial [bacterium]|nr:hypothetical protein [bacterium]
EIASIDVHVQPKTATVRARKGAPLPAFLETTRASLDDLLRTGSIPVRLVLPKDTQLLVPTRPEVVLSATQRPVPKQPDAEAAPR